MKYKVYSNGLGENIIFRQQKASKMCAQPTKARIT